jgi:hypothetical protein
MRNQYARIFRQFLSYLLNPMYGISLNGKQWDRSDAERPIAIPWTRGLRRPNQGMLRKRRNESEVKPLKANDPAKWVIRRP